MNKYVYIVYKNSPCKESPFSVNSKTLGVFDSKEGAENYIEELKSRMALTDGSYFDWSAWEVL